MDELTDERLSSKGGSQNMFVVHLIQYRILPRPKTAKKRDFQESVTDRPMDRPTDRRIDPLIEMRGPILKLERIDT